jgi:hypothetical protein
VTTFKGATADFYVATGSPVPFTNLALTDSGDHATYGLSSSDTHRYWDENTAVTIQTSPDGVTWSTVATSNYTLQYVGGKVTFTAAQAGVTQVRASVGAYFTVSQCGSGVDWELTTTTSLNKATVFGGLWKQQRPGIHDASVKFSRLYLDLYFVQSMGVPFIASLYVDTVSGHRYEGYVRFKQDQIKNSEEAIPTEDVDLDLDSALYYL